MQGRAKNTHFVTKDFFFNFGEKHDPSPNKKDDIPSLYTTPIIGDKPT